MTEQGLIEWVIWLDRWVPRAGLVICLIGFAVTWNSQRKKP